MVKVKQITLDRHERQLLVRALYEERKKLLELGEDVAALEELNLKGERVPVAHKLRTDRGEAETA